MRRLLIPAALAAMLLIAAPSILLAATGDYEKGIAYLRAGKADEAIKLLEPLAATDKDNPYLSYHLGIAYYKTGRLDDAYASFKRTQPLAAKAEDAGFQLGVAFSNLGVEYYRADKRDMAEKCFAEALSVDPNDGDSRYYLGLTKIEEGHFKGALAELNQAADAFSSDPSKSAAVQNAIGMAYARMQDNNSAIAAYNNALGYEPNNVEALYYLGQISYKEHGYAAASPYFDRIAHAGATDEKTKDALFTTFFNIGVDFQDRGKSDTAVEMFERASLLKPNDAETHYYIGYNLMASEKYEEAAAEFRQALSLDPKLSRAKAQMDVAGKFASDKAAGEAAGLMSSGEYYAALPLYEKAVSLDPTNDTAAKGLASARAAARKDTQKRISEAMAQLDKGDYKSAKAGSDELSRLNPGSKEAKELETEIKKRSSAAVGTLLSKAAAAESRNALGEASAGYASVLEIDPDNQKALDGKSRTGSVITQARQKASKAVADGLLAEARAAYKELLRYVPGDEEAAAGLKKVEDSITAEVAHRVKDAKDSFGSEDYTMAAYHAGRALELDPDNRDAKDIRERVRSRTKELVGKYVKDGDDNLAAGQRDNAAASYESALALDPDNQEAKSGLAKARSARAVAGSEDEIKRLYLEGVDHYTKGELDEAVDSWRRVLKLDPGNEKAASSIKRAREKMSQTGGSSTQN